MVPLNTAFIFHVPVFVVSPVFIISKMSNTGSVNFREATPFESVLFVLVHNMFH